MQYQVPDVVVFFYYYYLPLSLLKQLDVLHVSCMLILLSAPVYSNAENFSKCHVGMCGEKVTHWSY